MQRLIPKKISGVWRGKNVCWDPARAPHALTRSGRWAKLRKMKGLAMEEMRRNPERLLRAIKLEDEENEKNRGHMKIFFGYAAGVGKTYAMLQAAHAAKERGVDIVVGYVEPHTRPQTMKLLQGLERIPPRSVKHNGIAVKEFDLDEAIRRHPALILVDELAHTNAAGSRHAKRHQDVEELLKAGIDVYTTVNVQHIESLNDAVASVTGILVRERIPDFVFDNAAQVELVDIEPQELLDRLQAGDVYKKEQAKRAMEHFFTIENLIALREMALRRCADRVNLLSENARIKSGGEYHTEEHILVCLSAAPSNTKIIRTAARMAQAFHGAFTALYVETPDYSSMGEEDRKRLQANMRLAGQLGARIEMAYGEDAAFQIAEFARLSGVSRIVVGRSTATRRFPFGRPPLTEKLILLEQNIDIHIIPDGGTQMRDRVKRARVSAADIWNGKDAIQSLLLLLGATGIGFFFWKIGLGEANIIIIYILAVLLTAVLAGHQIYSLISAGLGVVVFNLLFTEPRFTLAAYEKGYPVTFVVMLLAAFLTSSLAVRLKNQAKQSAFSAYRMQILFDTSHLLEQASERGQVVAITAAQLLKLLNRSLLMYLAENGELLAPEFFPAGGDILRKEYVSANERAVAGWVLKNNKHAGATTDTLSNAQCLYLSIRVNEQVYGVVGIVMEEKPLDTFENSILLSVLGECALALENKRDTG